MSKYEAIILCGGKGSRVSRYTKKIPKCLIKIHGKPFLFYQLNYLKKNNIKNVILSVSYKAEQIENYVKNNINFINIKIVNDGKNLLGTGGAIIKSIKFLKNYFYVIYGDSYLNFELKNLRSINKFSTMAIFKNKNKYDKSNVERKKSNFIIYDKSQKNNNHNYNYIDYGVTYLKKKNLKNYIKRNMKFDLSTLLQKISKDNKLKGYVVRKRFYEIGSYSGIREFKNFLKK